MSCALRFFSLLLHFRVRSGFCPDFSCCRMLAMSVFAPCGDIDDRSRHSSDRVGVRHRGRGNRPYRAPCHSPSTWNRGGCWIIRNYAEHSVTNRRRRYIRPCLSAVKFQFARPTRTKLRVLNPKGLLRFFFTFGNQSNVNIWGSRFHCACHAFGRKPNALPKLCNLLMSKSFGSPSCTKCEPLGSSFLSDSENKGPVPRASLVSVPTLPVSAFHMS